MIYPDNFEAKVGFDKIRILISEHCLSPLGVECADMMGFSLNHGEVVRMLEECDEFCRILQSDVDFPCDNFYDVRPALKRIRIEGTYMEAQELFDLRRSMNTIINVIGFFKVGDDENDVLYPRLKSQTEGVTVFPEILKRADSIIDKFGNIRDNASPLLNDIRREINSTMNGISRSLANIIRRAREDGFVDKDITPAMRDGRLVIPVVPAHKRKIKGIVHDESASGKTVFIEPAEVVEANNRIRELESEEKREIIRILTAFTDTLRPIASEITDSYTFLGVIDFIRAKALFSISINAKVPKVDDCRQVDWFKAVHPLLFLSLKRHGKQVVPLDIRLDEKERILLISGPNAGGKSVCLKTVGLLQYMLQCGIPIPMNDNSRAGIFEDIFIDIGDEQSIEDDLSTYSSHLLNMKQFIKGCSNRSLLLIDEFGGGTEPRIGGAIAEATLDRFNKKEAFGVITTHYQNLKQFAEDHVGIINGAMLYDRHLMQPLFKLSIGNPGSSFAIEIARKIGLPEDVISEASDIVGQEYVSMDKYLQDIVRDKQYWENKRQSVRLMEKRLEELTERYETDIKSIDKERKEILRNAKNDAGILLEQANAKIENTIREIRERQADKEHTKTLREEMRKFKEGIATENADTDRITRKIEKINERKKDKKATVTVSAATNAPLGRGDAVRLKGENIIGEILSIEGKNTMVAFGLIKSTVKIDKLERVSRSVLKKQESKSVFLSATTTNDVRQKQLNFKSETDVRGLRGEEAIEAVAAFLDTAILSGYSSLRILHGTGNGILQQLIRKYLKTISAVKSFRDEDIQLGGAGVTVVELK
ncbi:MAG: Smr/MutS family protein [Bacteroidales bacterium]